MKLSYLFAAAVLMVSVPAFSANAVKPAKAKRLSTETASAVKKDEATTSEVRTSSTSPALRAVKGTRVRPMLGYNFFDPKSLNNRLGEFGSATNTSYKIGGGPTFGLSVDYPVIENLYVGARIDYFRASSNKISVGTGQAGFNHQTVLSGLPFSAMVSYQLPVTSQVDVGATAAVGVPFFYRVAFETTNSNNQGMPNGTATYSDNPITGSLSVYGDYSFSERVGLRLEGGYRLISSENMTLDEPYANEKAGSLMKDRNNAPVKADASSFHTIAALVVKL